LGEQAATQVRTNMANTVTQLKRILGRKLNEPGVQKEFEDHLHYKAVGIGADGNDIGIKVSGSKLMRAIIVAPRSSFAHFVFLLSFISPNIAGQLQR
jgi:molecular chaperone DnaK (HSP70)